ncbi:MAG TPA: hypothetical protein VF179_09205 [Thermoanaerobaculia bacterium]|nr:hypothetical protein [Thermoanaerobaculia bacterium]
MDLPALVLAVRDEIEEGFGCLSCINAVAALVDVAEKFGEVVSPFTVRLIVHNPALTERAGHPAGRDFEENLHRWLAAEGSFRHAVGIGDAPPGHWGGHLVGMADSGERNKWLLVDPTIQQAEVPHQGIVLDPVIVEIDRSYPEEGKVAWWNFNGCLAMYKFFPRDESFRETSAWTNMGQRRSVRDRVLERLRNA